MEYYDFLGFPRPNLRPKTCCGKFFMFSCLSIIPFILLALFAIRVKTNVESCCAFKIDGVWVGDTCTSDTISTRRDVSHEFRIHNMFGIIFLAILIASNLCYIIVKVPNFCVICFYVTAVFGFMGYLVTLTVYVFRN